jgi:peroxiredoxin
LRNDCFAEIVRAAFVRGGSGCTRFEGKSMRADRLRRTTPLKRALRRRVAAAALTSLLFATPAAYPASPLSGNEAPDFVLKSRSGHNLRLSEYRGQVVMLTFWATWCGDCRAQLGELAAVREHYQDAGVELLAVSLDQNVRQADAMADGLKAAYPVLHDAGGDVGKLYDVAKVPVMVLIDRSGIVRDVFEGYRRGSEQRYLERVQALLRE